MSATNGDGPVIDIDALMAERMTVRTAVIGGQRFRFGPFSLYAARLAGEGKDAEALKALLVDPEQYEALERVFPALAADAVLSAIYGEKTLGEARPRSRGSGKAPSGSKPSKPTSTPAAPASKAS